MGIKPSSWKQVIVYLALLAAAYLVFNLVNGNSLFNTPQAASVIDQGATNAAVDKAGNAPSSNVISLNKLPPECRTTLGLIKSGGPFPYSKDGTVFSNYEGLLPAKPGGYYHEYTVVTPGANDRGARRIVAGSNSEYYYTDDHYASFRLIQD